MFCTSLPFSVTNSCASNCILINSSFKSSRVLRQLIKASCFWASTVPGSLQHNDCKQPSALVSISSRYSFLNTKHASHGLSRFRWYSTADFIQCVFSLPKQRLSSPKRTPHKLSYWESVNRSKKATDEQCDTCPVQCNYGCRGWTMRVGRRNSFFALESDWKSQLPLHLRQATWTAW